jgi:hypothetical protein
MLPSHTTTPWTSCDAIRLNAADVPAPASGPAM